MVKLEDYNDRWAELEASTHPFAVVVMVHLKTRATRHDPRTRLAWKLRLVRHLYQHGHDRQAILDLFRFMDWLLKLPEGLAQPFQTELTTYEATMGRPYITRIKGMGIATAESPGAFEAALAV